jgi:hypothetical protein
MRNYSKGLIYQLRNKEDIDELNTYIGSTTNFRKRKNQHKYDCCNMESSNYNYKLYQFIRENGGWENWVMEWIEDYPCNSKRELERREGEITKEKQRLNVKIIGRTIKDWYEENKEEINKKKKDYRDKHKEIINKQVREYHDKHKEILKIKNKERYQKNKDKIINYQIEYRKNNKELISRKRNEKVNCECGCIVNKTNLSRHKISNKHLYLLQNKKSTCL